MSLTVIVCGSRTYTDERTIERQLAMLPASVVIVHGAARGADSIAERWCALNGRFAIGVPAQWDVYGKQAGVLRNRQMLERFHPDGCLAFHDKRVLAESRGTADMVKRCRQHGITVRVFGKDTPLRERLRWQHEPLLHAADDREVNSPESAS